MDHTYWNDWYSGGGWFLWFGIWFLLISSFGHLGLQLSIKPTLFNTVTEKRCRYS